MAWCFNRSTVILGFNVEKLCPHIKYKNQINFAILNNPIMRKYWLSFTVTSKE